MVEPVKKKSTFLETISPLLSAANTFPVLPDKDSTLMNLENILRRTPKSPFILYI